MEVNKQQVIDLINKLVATFGGMVAGWGAAKGWFTIDQALSVMNNQVFIGLIASAAVMGFGWFRNKKSQLVARVNDLPEVAGVVTKPTAAGRDLAEAVPEATVAPAGTVAAQAIAKA